MAPPAPPRASELRLGKRTLTVADSFSLEPGHTLTGFSQWRHKKILSEGTPGEDVKTHLLETPHGPVVARVMPVPRRLEDALAEAKATLSQAGQRDAKIERFLGALSGTDGDGRKHVVHISKYIPGRRLEDVGFSKWNRERRVRLAASVIRLVYENHLRNVLHNHLHHRNVILKENGKPELIDATQMSVIGEDPGADDPYGFRASGINFKLFDLSTFTRNALHPRIPERPNAAPLLKSPDELREALERAGYELPGMTTEEIIANLLELHKTPL